MAEVTFPIALSRGCPSWICW